MTRLFKDFVHVCVYVCVCNGFIWEPDKSDSSLQKKKMQIPLIHQNVHIISRVPMAHLKYMQEKKKQNKHKNKLQSIQSNYFKSSSPLVDVPSI